MIQLKVTWNNASNNLISNGAASNLIVVAQNNAAAPEDTGRRTPDSRVFTLADDGPVKVTFDLKVDVPTLSPSVRTMLKVVQRFDCASGVISVHSYDLDVGPVDIRGTHPLVSMPAALQASHVAVMAITTDFVDITTSWFESVLTPGTDARNAWDKGPHFDASFRVLANLSGTPKVWFASIANACVNADAVSALVFFRPAGFTYQSANDDFSSVFNPVHNDRLGLNFFKIWRFLMDPVCDRGSTPPQPVKTTIAADPAFHGALFFDHMDRNGPVPAAMERSLKEANKPVVVLFPVVNGSDYGTSRDADLADKARTAVACLHSMGIVMRDAKKTPFTGLKRFGIAGFSFGGEPMWKALENTVKEANKTDPKKLPNRIREIYVFDANGWAAQQGNPVNILTTASQVGDLRLRVVAATPRAANLASFPAGKLTSSSHPNFKANPDVYDLAKTKTPAGNPRINSWYLHFTKVQFDKLGPKWFTNIGAGPGIPDEGTWDRGARHQFSVFGGEDPTTGETFFCRFLKDSGF